MSTPDANAVTRSLWRSAHPMLKNVMKTPTDDNAAARRLAANAGSPSSDAKDMKPYPSSAEHIM